MKSIDASTERVINKLRHAQNNISTVISLFDDERNCNEVLRLTRLARQEIKEGTEMLIRNYIVECSSRLKGGNSTYYVQEIVKSFGYLN